MTDIDPYAVLGVARSATRLEVARAYRALAKRWHPDAAGEATPQARAESMARINQAWHILSNPARRAQWDAMHGGGPLPHWGAAGMSGGVGGVGRPASATAGAGSWSPPVMRRPAPTRPARTSVRDSGWLAVVVGGALLVLFLAGVGVLSQLGVAAPYPWSGETETFSTAELSFAHPEDWTVVAGADDPALPHGVVAHVVSFDLDGVAPCTRLAESCAVTGEVIPPGEVSVVVTRWEGGTPPVPDPIRRRTYGLDADRIIGGQPAAFRWDSDAGRAIGWWQLSPPGFPERWYEVVAEIRGRELAQEEGLAAVDAMLSTLEFGPAD